jgi:hypothetical protein
VVPAALFGQLNAAQVAHAAPDGTARVVFNCAESLGGQVRHPVSVIFERGQLRFHVRAAVRARVQINVKRVRYVSGHDGRAFACFCVLLRAFAYYGNYTLHFII